MQLPRVIDYVIHFKRSNGLFFSFFLPFLSFLDSLVDEKAQNVVDFKAPRVDDQDNIIFEFCYPEPIVGRQKERKELFSFILTGCDGLRKYGYCLRKIFPTSSECFCVIAQNGSFEFYEKVLMLFEKYLPNVDAIEQLADSFIERKFPFPGETIHNNDPAKRLINFSLLRPINDTFANTRVVSTGTLINKFGASEVVDILSHLLLERKFLFVSNDLTTLSNTISSFTTLMFPFVWQHVLIPLLPKSLVTYCAAPMPFIIGCLRNLYPQVVKECGDLSDVFIIDIDSGNYMNKPDYPVLLISDTSVGLRNILTNVVKNPPRPEDDAFIRAQILKFYQRLFLGYQKCFKDVKKKEEDKDNPRFKPIQFKWTKFMKKLDRENEVFMTEFHESQLLNMFFEEREDMLINNQSLQTKCPLLLNSTAVITDTTQTCHWKVLTDLIQSPTPSETICFLCQQDILANMPCSMWEGKAIHSKCYRCLACFKVMVGDKESSDHRCMYCTNNNVPVVPRTEKDYQSHFNNKQFQKAIAKKKRKREIRKNLDMSSFLTKSEQTKMVTFEISEPTNFKSMTVDIKTTNKPKPSLPPKTFEIDTNKNNVDDSKKDQPKKQKPVLPKKTFEHTKTSTETKKSPPKQQNDSFQKRFIAACQEPLSTPTKNKNDKTKKSSAPGKLKQDQFNSFHESPEFKQQKTTNPKSQTISKKKGANPPQKTGGVAKLAGMYESMN